MASADDKIRACIELLDQSLQRGNWRARKTEADGKTLTLQMGETIKLVLKELWSIQDQEEQPQQRRA